MTQKTINPKQSVYAKNTELANKLRKLYDNHNIKAINIMGSIGSGKTSILEKISSKLNKTVPILVINGDLTTSIDADRIKKAGATSIQINTGKGCHLDAKWINGVIENNTLLPEGLKPFQGGFIFIENVGNLICPASWDVGAHYNIVVTSMSEGPYHVKKHPIIFKISQVAVINKIDLKDVMEFSPESLRNDALEINPELRVFYTSCKTEEGIEELIKYITQEI